MIHLRAVLHVPSKRLTQDDLDTFIECITRMALQQNKGGRPFCLILDNNKPETGEIIMDNHPDFVGSLDNTKGFSK